MPRRLEKYVQSEVTRHGKRVFYYREGGKGPRIRLRAPWGSAEYKADLLAAQTGAIPAKPTRGPRRGTFAWLVREYTATARFDSHKPSTQRTQLNQFKRILETGGEMMIDQITVNDVAAGQDRRKNTPSAANNYVKLLHTLFEWAVSRDYLKENPAARVEKIKIRSKGRPQWTREQIAAYREKHPMGTRARLALDLLIYTGARRSDIVQLGRQHIQDGFIVFATEKTDTDIDIPLLEPLRQSIEATPHPGELTFLPSPRGGMWSAAAFGNKFKEWCDEAGVSARAHGLRKAGAALVAEQGGTHAELMAIFGWADPKMASYYIREANRKRLSGAAGLKLVDGIDAPHPRNGAGK